MNLPGSTAVWLGCPICSYCGGFPVIRSTALAAAVATVALAAPAAAAGCPYVTDPVGDTNVLSPVSWSPAIDLVAAGVQVDATTLTTMVEVDDLVPPGPLDSTAYRVNFVVGGALHHVYTIVHLTPGGVSGSVHVSPYTELPGGGRFSAGGDSVRATATADYAADRIRLTVPLSALPPGGAMPAGTVLSDFGVTATKQPGTVATNDPVPAQVPAVPDAGTGGDSAYATTPYVAGDPGCV